MLRLIGLVVLVGSAFGFGYFWGKQPAANLEQTVKDFSRQVVDTTLGIERDVQRRRYLVDAKANIVQAKSDLFNKNHAEATKELEDALESLESMTRGTKTAVDPHAAVRSLASKIQDIRADLSLGKKVARAKLEDVQKELDLLLRK